MTEAARTPALAHQAPSEKHALRLVLLLGLLVLGLITAGAVVRLAHSVRHANAAHNFSALNDFDRWMRRIPAHLTYHADLYDERSANTVLDMGLLAPFTHLSRANAQIAWALCKPALVIGIAAFLLGILRGANARISPAFLLLVLVAWAWPTIGDIQEGQTNLLMLLPLAAGLWAAQREETPGFTWLAGLLIALAVAIKVTPLIFLPYTLWRRRWKLSAAILLGIVAWFLLVPALFFGWRQTVAWQSQWVHIMLFPYARGDVPVLMGESLPSFLTKLLRHVPAFISDKSGHRVAHYMNIANLSAQTVGHLVHLLLVAIGLTGLWWMRRPLVSFRSRRYLLEIGAIACFMLWASQWTLVAHYVTLIIPLLAVGMVATGEAYPRPTRILAFAALLLAVVLMTLTSDLAKWIAGPDGREYMLMYNVCLAASASLAGALFFAGFHTPARET